MSWSNYDLKKVGISGNCVVEGGVTISKQISFSDYSFDLYCSKKSRRGLG